MALEQRIEALKKRHIEIDLAIVAEQSRPTWDTTIIRHLKAEKLMLKDSINRLMSETRVAA